MRFYQSKNADSYKKLERLSFVAFLSNFPNFFIVLFTAILSGTVVVWVDTLVSFGETLHNFVVWYVAHKMRKETGDKYNYGLGRLEVFTSFICDILVSLGMVGIIIGAVLSFNAPLELGSSILLFVLVKCSNSIYDLVFYIKQLKICRLHPSKLNETEKKSYRNMLLNDVIVGSVILICYLFRQYPWVRYFNPIVSILLALFFLTGYIRHIRHSVTELSDSSLPIPTQDAIFDIVYENPKIIKRIRSVNCRRLNGKAHVDITLLMKDETTFSEMRQYLCAVKEKIIQIEPEAEVFLVIDEEADT